MPSRGHRSTPVIGGRDRVALGLGLVALCVVAVAGSVGGCDAKEPTPAEEQAAALTELFSSGEVVFVGPLSGLAMGMSRAEVAAHLAALATTKGYATRDFGGAQFTVEFDRADRVVAAFVETSTRGLGTVVRERWGTPALESGQRVAWTNPKAGLVASLEADDRRMTFRPYTPLDTLLGPGDGFGIAGLALLGSSLGELKGKVELSVLDDEARDPSATFRVAETELRSRRGDILVTLKFAGEGEAARVVAYSLKLKVDEEADLQTILDHATTRYGASRQGQNGSYVFSEGPLVALEPDGRGYRLFVEQRRPLAELLSARVGLWGPLAPLNFEMTEEQARAAAPEVFASPGGYRPPEMERFQFKARFDPRTHRLADVYVYGPPLELVHTLRTVWGAPAETGAESNERRLWWHNEDDGVRCMMQEGVGGAQFECGRYLGRAAIAALVGESVTFDSQPLLGVAEGAVTSTQEHWLVGFEPGKTIDLQLPPLHTELKGTTVHLNTTGGTTQSAVLVFPYRVSSASRDIVLEVLRAAAGAPTTGADDLGRTTYHWASGMSAVDDVMVSAFVVTRSL